MRAFPLIFAMLALPPTTARAGNPSDWHRAVLGLTSPLDARTTPEEARPALTRACDAGTTAACRLELGELLQSVLEMACTQGDPTACLGHAWRTQKQDPAGAFEVFQAQCTEGVARACVSMALARSAGEGTWGARSIGHRQAEALCEEGVGTACIAVARMTGDKRPRAQRVLLQKAVRLGGTGAAGDLARIAEIGPARDVALEDACVDGHGASCWEIATTTQGDAAAYADRACGLGVDLACVARAALGLEQGVLDVAAATQIVNGHCNDGIREACVASHFYRNGGRPPPFATGTMGRVLRNKTLEQMIPYILDCYRERLERGDRDVLHVPLELATDADGVFVAATSRSDDHAIEACFAEQFLGSRGPAPAGGPSRFRISVPLTHEAEIHVSPFGEDMAGRELSDFQWRLVGLLGLDANLCYLEHGGSVYDKQFAILKGTLTRQGWYLPDSIVESSADSSIDECLQDMLRRLHVPEVEMSFDQEVWVRFDFNNVSRAPRWVGWGERRMGVPPLDLSRHNHTGPRPSWKDGLGLSIDGAGETPL